VNVKIPERQLGAYYRWAVFSYWTGPPAGCADTCFDAAPNGPPPILHDLTRPTVNLTSTPLRIWESATTSDFEFPFSVSDPESGLRSWKVQSRPVGGTVWTTVASGTSGGPKHPSIAGAPGRYTFRVVAEDRQGNRTTKSRLVYVPTDDADLVAEFSVAPTSTPDLAAFGATYSAMSSGSFTHTTEASECLFELIGPGTGDWWIQVSPTDGITTTIQDEDVDDLPRQTLYSDQTCGAEYVISLVSGTFGLDAVLG
jgi:hypothetical protein